MGVYLPESLGAFCKGVDGLLLPGEEPARDSCNYMDKDTCDELGGELTGKLIQGGEEIQRHPELGEYGGYKGYIFATGNACKIKNGISEALIWKTRYHHTKQEKDSFTMKNISGTRGIPAGSSSGSEEGLRLKMKNIVENIPKIVYDSGVHWYGTYDDWNEERGDVGGRSYDIQEMPDGSLIILNIDRVASSLAFGPHMAIEVRFHIKGKTVNAIKQMIKKRKDPYDYIEEQTFKSPQNPEILDVRHFLYTPLNEIIDLKKAAEEFFNVDEDALRKAKGSFDVQHGFTNHLIANSSGTRVFETNKEYDDKPVMYALKDIAEKANKVH